MSTLPITLPQCGATATVRIEIYSAGSLDASAYTCDAHTIGALAEISRAGMQGNAVGMAPTVDRACGHVHVYPTGHLADRPSPEQHPQWCDRGGCDQRGQHRSAPMSVATGHPEPVIAHVALTQGLAAGADPGLTLTVVDGDAGSEITFTLPQGRVLSYQLRRLLDQARGYAGNRRPSW